MWTCETKVGITCLVVICGSANTVAFAAAILQWEEMVVSLSYGVVFFGTSIFFLMLLFSILATDNQKGMTLMTHVCKTRPIFLLIFLGLFNAELRGLIHVKYERSTAVTPMPASMPPPGPLLLQSQKLLAAGKAATQRHNRSAGFKGSFFLRQMTDEDPHPEEPIMKLDQDVVMYLSCGMFICNVIIDCFVVRRLSLYTAKMSSLPMISSGSMPTQPSGSQGQQ